MKIFIALTFLYLLSFLQCSLFGKDTSTLKISTQPRNAKIYLDSTFCGYSPVTIDTVKFGLHTIKIEKENYEGTKLSLNINSNFMEKFVKLKKKMAKIEISVFPANSSVKIDGIERKTKNLKISFGEHIIIYSKPGYFSQKKKIKVNTKSSKLNPVILEPKSKKTSLLLSIFIPGSGQIYSDREYIGMPIFISAMAGLGYLFYPNIGYNAAKSSYLKSVERYRKYKGSIDYYKYQELESDMVKKYKILQDEHKKRNIILVLTTCILIYNVWDAYYNFPVQKIYIDKEKFGFYINFKL